MGKFHYNATTRADIDDRLLLHLQIVIGTKLRRGEAFPFTWKDDASLGDGRTTVWVSASSTLIYRYHGSRMPFRGSKIDEAAFPEKINLAAILEQIFLHKRAHFALAGRQAL